MPHLAPAFALLAFSFGAVAHAGGSPSRAADPAERLAAPSPEAPVEPPVDAEAGCEILWPEGGARDAFILETWPGGIVPYTFNTNVTELNRSRTLAAMDEIMDVCAVRFVPRTTESHYLVIRDSDGNSSFVGRIGGPQTVNLASWHVQGIIIHELMHALGTWHEQSRPDRDAYVVIEYENVQPGREHNFDIRPSAVPEGPYDFLSVMHYGAFAFSANGQRTITMAPGFEMYINDIGNRTGLSVGDILGLTTRYGVAAVDLNRDGWVDGVDLAILIAAWGTAEGDVTGDAACDAEDLAALLTAWGRVETGA